MRVISNNGVPLKTSHILWSELIHTCTKASCVQHPRKTACTAGGSCRLSRATLHYRCADGLVPVEQAEKGGLLIFAQSLCYCSGVHCRGHMYSLSLPSFVFPNVFISFYINDSIKLKILTFKRPQGTDMDYYPLSICNSKHSYDFCACHQLICCIWLLQP